MLLDYMKGHMGGNTIALLLGDQVPGGREIPVAQRILSASYLACHEAGLLYHPREGGHLKVRIVEPGSSDYLIACGGLTQVLGKALVETSLGRHFGIETREPLTQVLLETDAGPLKLNIQVEEGRASQVVSDLTLYGEACYRDGVYPLNLQGVEVMRVGYFMVVAGEALAQRYPGRDFAALDAGARKVLVSLQEEFLAETGPASLGCALYDWNPCRGGDIRAVFPHNIREGWIEPACGTGTVAIGIALTEWGTLPQDGRVALETGGEEDLGGPDRTLLDLKYEGGRLTEAFFSHSLIQLTSVGQVMVD